MKTFKSRKNGRAWEVFARYLRKECNARACMSERGGGGVSGEVEKLLETHEKYTYRKQKHRNKDRD